MPVAPAKSPLVLVVEDEPLLRMMAVDMIEDAGFRTVEAGNADEAVRILEARTDVRVVFTDINMPGSMDGMTLAAAVRHRWPPIDLIITSGQYAPRHVELPARSVFMSKPYRAADVVQMIERMAA